VCPGSVPCLSAGVGCKVRAIVGAAPTDTALPVRFLPDERLYSDAAYCLRYLRDLDTTPQSGPGGERFHLYWSGPFSAKQAFAVKSILATQHVGDGGVCLWLDPEDGYADHERNPVLAPLLPHVSVRPFDPVTECRGTPLEGSPELYEGVTLTARSDLVRVLTLYKHGGIYLDIDMMLLRDLRELLGDPFGSEELCYQWSDQPHANHAVLRLHQGGETAQAILERCVEKGSCDPRAILRFDGNETLDMAVLPCAFFDPLWLHADGKDALEGAPFDGFDGFFRRFGWRFRPARGVDSYRDFFPGAFAFHWHNQWDAAEHERSYFGRFDREFDALLGSRA
jgi:hypothetical protein